jgi:S-adenosylmethionine synthetase
MDSEEPGMQPILLEQLRTVPVRQQQGKAVEEVYVWLGCPIGRPVNTPWMASAQVILAPGARLAAAGPSIQDIMHAELSDLPHFMGRLVRGEVSIW